MSAHVSIRPCSQTREEPSVAKYLTLAPTFLRTDDCVISRRIEAGTTIAFSGAPGSSLQPLDDAARAAMSSYLAGKHPNARRHVERQARRLRAGLSRSLTRMIEGAHQRPAAEEED